MPRSRGRSRNARPRLSRMDAAVDAMLPFGFAEGKIKKHVKELLKVYGGDEGWPFIEEFSYKVLLDSILEDGDNQDQVVQNENLLEDKSCGEEEPLSIGASDTEKNTVPPDIIESSAAAAVAESIPLPLPPPPPPLPPPPPPPALPPPPPPPPPPLDYTSILLSPPPPLVVGAANRRRRVPCYGWIDDEDEDEDEFIDLRPMEKGERATLGVTNWSKKRRSRWDVKPGDPYS